ncbi:L,D-transpeptidase family protein [Caulobacter sp. KR2-114]|uniref:L,D-transpeptidase family protein n=1 Tax=Caulobacter sp. KR2-114 TaxID=3400912 RepID=UPI003C10B4C2
MSSASPPSAAIPRLPPQPPHNLTRRAALSLASAAALAACHRAAGTLGQGMADPEARAVYAAREGRAAWTGDRARTLARIIAGAPAHGLPPTAFAPATGKGAALDEALTLSALKYAHALASGLVDPRKVEKDFTLRRNKPDLAAGLAKALGGDLEGWFAALAPADAGYKAISAAYLAAAADSPQARQLAANLERRRWLDRAPPDHRIDVNIATAVLAYRRPGQPDAIARVVVGGPKHQTPCIEAAFEQLVVNPPWRVPTEIAAKEILPKGPAYMAREDMRMVDGRVEQQPGPKSALGQVKFDLKDPYDIYLHDTPAKALFAAAERHRSHGCVRVDNAVAFARGLAAETGRADAFDQALATQDTHEVALGQSIPVRLFYHTAEPDPAGQVVLARDVYGTDDRLAEALGLGAARTSDDGADDGDTGP